MFYLYYKILFLNLLVIFLVFIKVFNSRLASKNFINLFILLTIMVFVNMFLIFTKDFQHLMSILVFLSFYSIVLILFGFGLDFKINVMILFKAIPDLLCIILFFNLFISSKRLDLILFFFEIENEVFLFCIFSVYSFISLWGFWIYWAMEASYFISSFIHSCGFISLGVIIFSKIFLSTLIVSNIYSILALFFLFNYFVFSMISTLVKDVKKSFGFYSASSICFLFFSVIYNPIVSLIYFFLSSLIKIITFEALYYLSKVNFIIVVVFLLFILDLINFKFLFINNSLSNDLYIFMFFIKSIVLSVFIFKVLSIKLESINTFNTSPSCFNYVNVLYYFLGFIIRQVLVLRLFLIDLKFLTYYLKVVILLSNRFYRFLYDNLPNFNLLLISVDKAYSLSSTVLDLFFILDLSLSVVFFLI